MITYFYCKCGAEIPCETDLGEHFIEMPDKCDECGVAISEQEQEKQYSNMLADGCGRQTDYAHDLLKDA